jgi:hypothetical protein
MRRVFGSGQAEALSSAIPPMYPSSLPESGQGHGEAGRTIRFTIRADQPLTVVFEPAAQEHLMNVPSRGLFGRPIRYDYAPCRR